MKNNEEEAEVGQTKLVALESIYRVFCLVEVAFRELSLAREHQIQLDLRLMLMLGLQGCFSAVPSYSNTPQSLLYLLVPSYAYNQLEIIIPINLSRIPCTNFLLE